ncbi:unnamed protein product [Zymoseptoria tritici ST99CH_3D7]|uniref:Uncharacterized protein n=1 Tax=Zymoseptoria tritici (strain ST99CH_3D7) TaxID=1276538 RepID=A0A1X7RK83_ZYMT9|nr:unnamed protein product [Zymoseptoria tritici ST99CH_3D7]
MLRYTTLRVPIFATPFKMKGVWEAVTGEERIVIPDSRLVEGVLKVFVKTGRPWDECTEQHRIELDIKQAGFRNSPRRLEGNVDRVGPFDVLGEPVEFNVLGIPSMMRIKVECCLTREEQRDFDDVRFMLRQYSGQVYQAIDEGIVDPEELSEVLGHDKIGDENVRNELVKLVDKYVT